MYIYTYWHDNDNFVTFDYCNESLPDASIATCNSTRIGFFYHS